MSLRHPVANRHTLYSCMSLSADSSLMLGIVWRVPPPSFLQNVCICTCVRVNGCAQCVGVGDGVCVCVRAWQCMTCLNLWYVSSICRSSQQLDARLEHPYALPAATDRYIYFYSYGTPVFSRYGKSVFYISLHMAQILICHMERNLKYTWRQIENTHALCEETN